MCLFSVITVCYNSSNTIERTIKSMLNQKNENYEYIIIDGKSSDNTLDIIKKYEPLFNGKLTVISEKDNGIYDAMNKGLSVSNGKYIGFLNSDDYYTDNILKIIEKSIQMEDEFIYGDTKLIYNFDKKEMSRIEKSIETVTNNSLGNGMGFSHQSCFVKREIFDKVGNFNIDYKIGADWDFTIRCYQERVRFRKLNVVISCFSKDGVSSKPHIAERHKIRKKNKLYKIIDGYFIKDLFNPANIAQLVFSDKIYMNFREKYHLFKKMGCEDYL